MRSNVHAEKRIEAAHDPDAGAADAGIMLGHWVFGAPFAGTSMIGFIAFAGVIVRNSMLPVDFVQSKRGGLPLGQALLEAGAIAAMIGAAVILAEPIFQGLAISLLCGLALTQAASRSRRRASGLMCARIHGWKRTGANTTTIPTVSA